MSILHLVRGIPGSGKSSFAKRAFPGVLLLENDMFHMHNGEYEWMGSRMKDAIAWCGEMAETALKNSMDVVIANTLTRRSYIDFYRKLAEKWCARFKVWRCIGHFKNVHGLTDSMVKGFEDSMEDWPGETIVQPEQNEKMTCEVFDVSTNAAYGRFPDMRYADMFLDSLAETDLASQVQIRLL